MAGGRQVLFEKVLLILSLLFQQQTVFCWARYWERDGWVRSNETVDLETTRHHIIFGLNFDVDYELYDSISDPSSPNFRKFLTKEETMEYMQTSSDLENCRNAVVDSLEAHNVSYEFLSSYQEYLNISGTWSNILSLFDPDSLEVVRFHRIEGEENNRRVVVRAIPKLPDIDIIDFLKNSTLSSCLGGMYRLSDFPPWSRPRIRFLEAEDNDGGGRLLNNQCKSQKAKNKQITPQVLFDMYEVPSNPVDNLPSSTSTIQYIYEGTSEQVSNDDLKCFTQSFDLNEDVTLTGNYAAFDTNTCGGGNSCGEPNLDSQYLVAVNQGVDVNYQAYDDMDTLFTTMKKLPDDELPIVVSISYGIAESNAYKKSLKQMCSEIASLTGRGVTFFASTGDTGATNSGKEGVCGDNYNVNFPASCPYVVAVGGTTGFSAGKEVVCNAGESVITTGGGFSEIFTSKDYNLDFQQSSVQDYLSQVDSGIQAGYPTNGRGLPDISAAAASYEITLGGKIGLVDGTSASCPVMAGITARISLQNGGQRFGNILPLLYNSNNTFIWFDVVDGQNSGNGKEQNCPGDGPIVGFEATDGWDPATGLGTLGTGIGYEDYAAVLSSAPPPEEPPKDGLSTGAIIGIVIAALVVLCCCLADAASLAKDKE